MDGGQGAADAGGNNGGTAPQQTSSNSGPSNMWSTFDPNNLPSHPSPKMNPFLSLQNQSAEEICLVARTGPILKKKLPPASGGKRHQSSPNREVSRTIASGVRPTRQYAPCQRPGVPHYDHCWRGRGNAAASRACSRDRPDRTGGPHRTGALSSVRSRNSRTRPLDCDVLRSAQPLPIAAHMALDVGTLISSVRRLTHSFRSTWISC